MVLDSIKTLVSRAHLIHGDFSPYNIVVWHQKPYIIDLSQAVLTSHPDAARLLESDLKNIEEFFRLKGVETEEFNRVAVELLEDVRYYHRDSMTGPDLSYHDPVMD